MHIGGIVLCGGQSLRMGRPKAWLPFGDEVLLQRVVRVVGEVVQPIVVVAAPGQTLPTLPHDVEIVRDDVEYRGPLGGLVAGLAALNGRVDAAYLSGCDLPFLSPAFVRRMIAFAPATAVPRVDGYLHPLAAIYSMSVFNTALSLLKVDQRRLIGLFDHVPTRIIEAIELVDVEPKFLSLRNINTPEEYAAALATRMTLV